MAAPGRKVPKAVPRRGALRGAAPQAREGRAVVAGQPADAAAPGRRRRPTTSRTYEPADPAQGGARRSSSPCRLRPGAGRPCSASASPSRLALVAVSARRRRRRAGLGGVVLSLAGARRRPGHRRGQVAARRPASRSAEHPLWSSFVWRNELADTFVEVLAAPWFARAARDAGAQRLAAAAGRQDRPRRLVRDLLAARDRPRRARRRRDRQRRAASCRPTCSTTGSWHGSR